MGESRSGQKLRHLTSYRSSLRYLLGIQVEVKEVVCYKIQGEVLAEDKLWRVFYAKLVLVSWDWVILPGKWVDIDKRMEEGVWGPQRIHEQNHCYSYTVKDSLVPSIHVGLFGRRDTITHFKNSVHPGMSNYDKYVNQR